VLVVPEHLLMYDALSEPCCCVQMALVEDPNPTDGETWLAEGCAGVYEFERFCSMGSGFTQGLRMVHFVLCSLQTAV
jgi:hypothetical protein